MRHLRIIEWLKWLESVSVVTSISLWYFFALRAPYSSQADNSHHKTYRKNGLETEFKLKKFGRQTHCLLRSHGAKSEKIIGGVRHNTIKKKQGNIAASERQTPMNKKENLAKLHFRLQIGCQNPYMNLLCGGFFHSFFIIIIIIIIRQRLIWNYNVALLSHLLFIISHLFFRYM